MLPYALLSCSSMPLLGIIIDTTKTRDTTASYASIFGAETWLRKEGKFCIYTSLFGV
jgi:hypothetical protein